MGWGEADMDFFHLGLILVLIMAFISGVVLIVGVVGVCCFHWLSPSDVEVCGEDASNKRRRRDSRRNDLRLDNFTMREGPSGIGRLSDEDPEPPPPYDILFPVPNAYDYHHQIHSNAVNNLIMPELHHQPYSMNDDSLHHSLYGLPPPPSMSTFKGGSRLFSNNNYEHEETIQVQSTHQIDENCCSGQTNRSFVYFV